MDTPPPLKGSPHLGKRGIATFIDCTLGLMLLFGCACLLQGKPAGQAYTLGQLFNPIALGIYFASLVLTEYFFAATPGHLATGLRVVRTDGSKPGLIQVFKRRLADCIELYLTLGILAVFLVRESALAQRLGDRWAGLLVRDHKLIQSGDSDMVDTANNTITAPLELL
ncbi:MAG: RDD family protein [Candidatus Pseudobacter hemicellulosilyticus]|uniref:RDD family protein n=1 Tax=Candidatus Pseudobacter hemicellulosilyticus TaxID=3121375 RepID=A0AAJ5WRF5_9BACT|nr:MAG: RDD family protein [Pseudobacter sp.]